MFAKHQYDASFNYYFIFIGQSIKNLEGTGGYNNAHVYMTVAEDGLSATAPGDDGKNRRDNQSDHHF